MLYVGTVPARPLCLAESRAMAVEHEQHRVGLKLDAAAQAAPADHWTVVPRVPSEGLVFSCAGQPLTGLAEDR